MQDEYSDGPGGLSGNDDAGQMSAWYVFASIGFYPVDPVSNEYLLCSPLFDKVTVQLPNKKIFQIICYKETNEAFYIDGIKLNGKLYDKNFLKHDGIMKGGRLKFFLIAQPTQRASGKSSRPSSLSDK